MCNVQRIHHARGEIPAPAVQHSFRFPREGKEKQLEAKSVRSKPTRLEAEYMLIQTEDEGEREGP